MRINLSATVKHDIGNENLNGKTRYVACNTKYLSSTLDSD